jgi:hypothetical protein
MRKKKIFENKNKAPQLYSNERTLSPIYIYIQKQKLAKLSLLFIISFYIRLNIITFA